MLIRGLLQSVSKVLGPFGLLRVWAYKQGPEERLGTLGFWHLRKTRASSKVPFDKMGCLSSPEHYSLNHMRSNLATAFFR